MSFYALILTLHPTKFTKTVSHGSRKIAGIFRYVHLATFLRVVSTVQLIYSRFRLRPQATLVIPWPIKVPSKLLMEGLYRTS
jgi:hypothetical protein